MDPSRKPVGAPRPRADDPGDEVYWPVYLGQGDVRDLSNEQPTKPGFYLPDGRWHSAVKKRPPLGF